jgi:tellurium resistance protein TerD
MAISLQKGGNVNLSKEAPGLSKLTVGLGWDVRQTDGAGFDIDSSAFLLKVDGKVRSDLDFIFYNNLKSTDGSVAHSGDNRTGAGDGDDETVNIDLARVPSDVERIAICVTIHEADARRQNFGQVQRAFVRCVNAANSGEIARFDLSEDGSVETSLVFGEVYRNGSDWKFKAVGQGYQGGLGALASSFGVKV